MFEILKNILNYLFKSANKEEIDKELALKIKFKVDEADKLLETMSSIRHQLATLGMNESKRLNMLSQLNSMSKKVAEIKTNAKSDAEKLSDTELISRIDDLL